MYGGFSEIYKKDTFIENSFEFIVLIRKTLFSFSIVFFNRYPSIQMFLFFIINLSFIYRLIKVDPYEDSKILYEKIAAESIFTLALFIMMLIPLAISTLNEKYFKFWGLFVMILFLLSGIVQTFTLCRQVIKNT